MITTDTRHDVSFGGILSLSILRFTLSTNAADDILSDGKKKIRQRQKCIVMLLVVFVVLAIVGYPNHAQKTKHGIAAQSLCVIDLVMEIEHRQRKLAP